jgi:hypothetical protein
VIGGDTGHGRHQGGQRVIVYVYTTSSYTTAGTTAIADTFSASGCSIWEHRAVVTSRPRTTRTGHPMPTRQPWRSMLAQGRSTSVIAAPRTVRPDLVWPAVMRRFRGLT